MASKTSETWSKRARRKRNMGKDRKAKLRSKGSTPVFPIHTAEIDAAAPPAQVSSRSPEE